jgi:hypothetical protein
MDTQRARPFLEKLARNRQRGFGPISETAKFSKIRFALRIHK